MLVAIPVTLVNSYYGILVYYWVNYMRPLELAWYIAYFDYGTYLAAALLMGYFYTTIHKDPLKFTHLWPFFLLWGLVTFSAVAAYLPAIAWKKWWELTKVAIICVMAVSIIHHYEERLKRLMLVIALSAGVLGAHGFKQALFTGGGTVKGPGGQLGENNDFAIFLNMMVPIIYYVSRVEENRRWRPLMIALCGAAAIACVFTYSRAGFLGLCTIVLVMSFKANKKWVGIGGLTLAAVLFLLFAPQRVRDRIASIKTASTTDLSTQSRFEAWKCAVEMAKRHPLVGVGPRNFTFVFNYFKKGVPWDTHNGFLRIMAESGIPAFLAFVFLIFYCYSVPRRMRRRLQKAGGPDHLIQYCHGLEVMIPAYIIGNLFNSRHDLDNFYYLVPVVACIRIQAEAWLAQNVMTDTQRRAQLFRQRFTLSPAAR